MAAFGRTIETARALAFGLGVLSAVGVWWAGRWLGLSSRTAMFGAIAAAAFPYSAWLGAAAVPEAPTAALVLIGIASLSTHDRRRAIGAAALGLACLSRYEAWPVAAVFVVFTLLDAGTRARRLLLSAAGLALIAPLAWLANGLVKHGDALFFVKRVSEYRRAIGMSSASVWDALSGYPSLVVRAEPELALVTLVTLGVLIASGSLRALDRHRRGALCIAAILGFLIVGDLRDGAPTHHAERALLAVWFWLALISTDSLASAWPRLSAPVRAASLALVGLAIAPAAGILRPWYAHRDSFIDRASEIEVGRAARLLARPDERLLVDTPDFGFWAVIAGFGAPERAAPIDDRDPRKPRGPDPFVSHEVLAATLQRANANLVVVSAGNIERARGVGSLAAERGGLALIRVTP